MNSEVKSIMVSVFALAIAAGMGMVNTVQIQETNEQVKVSDSFQGTNDDILNNEIIKLKTQIANNQNYDDILLIELLNKQGLAITSLQKDLNTTRTQLGGIANKMLVVEALQNKVTQATTQVEEMFSLVLLKSDGNYVPTGEYLQSEIIYISGKYDGNANKYDIIFKRSGQEVLTRTGLSLPTDGVFAYYFNQNHDQPVGSYTVTVMIDGKMDTISFEIN